MSRPNVAQRLHQTGRLLRTEGVAGVSGRLRDRASQALSPPANVRLPIAREHLLRAAEIADGGWALPPPAPLRSGQPLTINWVTVPPSPASGGHTTLFRMVAELERTGHTCVVYLDDHHGWSIEQHRRTVRSCWPAVRAEIRDVAQGIDDAHVIMATSWGTAYPVLASPAKGARCYFVADFEPSFYAAGSLAMLAEATYRFGFYGVTFGPWLAQLVRREYGMEAEHFDFACDMETYTLDTSSAVGARKAVCYYCRPSTPRRAHELAIATLDLFAERHPEIEIQLYGEPSGKLPFRANHLGFLNQAQLGALYNRCIAGLVLSATNVSLVPPEMLGCGCIPVVNDAEHNRMVLANDHVAYAPATPFELANALNALVERPAAERAEAATAAAASVSATTWGQAGAEVERILRGVVESRLALTSRR